MKLNRRKFLGMLGVAPAVVAVGFIVSENGVKMKAPETMPGVMSSAGKVMGFTYPGSGHCSGFAITDTRADLDALSVQEADRGRVAYVRDERAFYMADGVGDFVWVGKES